MDYVDIIAEVTDRTGYTDVATRAAMLTGMAENDLNRRLKVGDMEVSTTITSDTTGRADLPSDFLKARSLRYADREMEQTILADIEWDYCRYAIQGSELVTKYASTDFELDYYAALPALSLNGSNWLGDKYPEIYITAIMKQAFIAKLDAEKAAAAETLLASLIGDLASVDASKRFNALPWGGKGP